MIRRLSLFICVLAIAAASGALLPTKTASAAFNQNNLISDPMFEDSGTMMAGDINNFLNRYPGSCISPNSGFEAKLSTGYTPSGGFTFGNFASAGDVIATAAQTYGINP